MTRLFRITSIILIQALLVIDLSGAGNGRFSSCAGNNTLAPATQIDRAEFKRILSGLEETPASPSRREFLSLFFPPLAQEAAGAEKSQITGRRIKFNEFNQEEFSENSRAGQLLKITALFISSYNKLIKNPDQKTVMLPDKEAYKKLKAIIIEEIMKAAEDEFKSEMTEEILKDPEAAWRKLMFEVLPAYFAEKGVLFWADFSPVWRKGKSEPAALESFGLCWVEKIVPVTIENIWSQKVSFSELQVRTFLTDAGKDRMAAEIIPLKGQMFYGNVAVSMDEIEYQAQELFAQLNKVSGDIVTDSERISWYDYLRVSARGEKFDPLLFAQAKLIACVKEKNFSRQDIAQWLQLQNRYRYALSIASGGRNVSSQAGGINEKMVNEHVCLNKKGMLSAIRYADKKSMALEMLNLTRLYASYKVQMEDSVIKLAVLDNMISYIADNIKDYPDISLSSNVNISRRAQIAGQLYKLTPQQIGTIMEALYEQQKKQREVAVFYSTEEIYRQPQERLNWIERYKLPIGATAAFVLVSAAGFFGWLHLRKFTIRRIYRAVLKEVLDENLAAADRKKISDGEINELAGLMAQNRFLAGKYLKKLFKTQKTKVKAWQNPNILIQKTASRFDALFDSPDGLKKFITLGIENRLGLRKDEGLSGKKGDFEDDLSAFDPPDLSDESAGDIVARVVKEVKKSSEERQPQGASPDSDANRREKLAAILDKIDADLESRRGQINTDAFNELKDTVNELRREAGKISGAKEYTQAREAIRDLGNAVRQAPSILKDKKKQPLPRQDSLPQQRDAPKVEDKRGNSVRTEEAKPKVRRTYLANVEKVSAELKTQIKLLKEMIEIIDKTEKIDVVQAERFSDSIVITLGNGYLNGKFDANSRVIMQAESGIFELKVLNFINGSKVSLTPVGTQEQKDEFFKLSPQRLSKAGFFLQANTQSEQLQAQTLEEVKTELEDKNRTGVEVLNYILRLEAPAKAGVMEFGPEAAVALMLNNRFGLLHGGYGTAKTTVLLEAAEKIAIEKKKPVLILAPQHIIADEITLRAGNKGLPVLRCGNVPARFRKKEVQEKYSRHSDTAVKEFKKRFSQLNSKAEDNGCILTATLMGGVLDWLIAILEDPDAQIYLKDITLIIDEAALINYPELVTAVYRLKPQALFLVGDHIQYKPYKLAAKLSRNEMRKLWERLGRYAKSAVLRYEKSIFEQLINNPLYVQAAITKNFRNHWIIVELAQKWYEGIFTLQSLSKERNDPLEADALEIVDTSSWENPALETQDMLTGSYANVGEAVWIIAKAKEFLLKTGREKKTYEAEDIIIITPYRKQIELIKAMIDADLDFSERDKNILKENIVTSRQIQGGQRKVALVSLVRSDASNAAKIKDVPGNGNSANGRENQFLFDEETIIAKAELLLVSLTRATEKTAVIGNRRTLETLTKDAESSLARTMYAWIFDFGIKLKKRLQLKQSNLDLSEKGIIRAQILIEEGV